VPVLVGLLVAALLGPGMVAGAEPRVTVTRSIMIPGVAFNPMNEHQEYDMGISAVMGSATGTTTLFAPLWFPVTVVSIKKITLYAYDGSTGGDVWLWLDRAYPPGVTSTDPLGQVGTAGSIGKQVVSTTVISPRQTNTANYALMLRVEIRPGTSLYGVKVTYSYDAGA
jgi:hypothetical protein